MTIYRPFQVFGCSCYSSTQWHSHHYNLSQAKPGLDEHKRAIKNQRPDLSALCEHSITMDHIISWTEAKILELETDYRKRLSFESWHINEKLHAMNRNDGSSFISGSLFRLI